MPRDENPASAPSAATLTATEARILGALIEKEATTPDAYPLTENALTLACNQKNNRDPLMQLTPGEVGHALRSMEVRKLVRSVHGARAQRWEHRFAEALSVTAKQQALLGVLILRGPQTAAELFTRTGRLAGFDDLEDLRYSLDRMIQHDPPYVVDLGRAAGQREDRYMHLLCGPVAAEVHARAAARAQASPVGGRATLEARIEDLEAQIRSLREDLDALRGRTD